MSIGFYFFLNFFLINLKIEEKQEKQGLSLSRVDHLHTNVSLVYTSREFWQLN